MPSRLPLHLTILAAVALVSISAALGHPGGARAYGWTRGDVLAAIDGKSALVRCIVGAETGWTYEPYSVGDHGSSFGPVQLHSPGELETFYAWGGTDPYNPYSAVAFLEYRLTQGGRAAWHTCWGR